MTMQKMILQAAAVFFSVLLTAAELIPNGDFENGKTAPWQFLKGGKTTTLTMVTDSSPDGGSNVLAVNIRDERKVQLGQNLNLGPGTYKFSGWIDTTRCSRPGGYSQIYLVCSINGKGKNLGVFGTPGTVPGSGWRKYPWQKSESVITIPPGGKIKGVRISITNMTGTIMLDNLSLTLYGKEEQQADEARKEAARKAEEARKTAPQISFESCAIRSLYLPDEVPSLKIRLKNPAQQAATLSVKFRTVDYFGKPVRESTEEFQLKGNGTAEKVLKFPDCRKPGFYCTTAEWKAGKVQGSAQGSFVKVGPLLKKKDPLFGISYFSTMDPDSCDKMGVGTKGILFRWTQIRNRKERDQAMKYALELKKHGIEVVGDFSMSRSKPLKWMPKDKLVKGREPTMEEIKAVVVPFIEKTVADYKSIITLWSGGGEINLMAYLSKTALPDYIEFVKFTYTAVKKANPEASFIALKCSGADGRNIPRFPFIRKVLPEIKDYIDGFGPDQYTAGQRYGKGCMNLNSEEAQLRPIMLEMVRIAHEAGKKIVTIDEKGPSIFRSTPLDSPLGRTMANMMAREYIILKTVPEVRYWLYFRPDNWSKTTKADYGMWEQGNPRQVVSAYAATARAMAFAEFLREIKVHNDIPCWLFRKDGKYLATAWYNGIGKLKVTLPGSGAVQAADVQGNPVELDQNAFELGEAPVYLTAEKAETLEKLLAEAASGIDELSLALDRRTAGKTLLIVRNVSGRKITLKVKNAVVTDPVRQESLTIPFTDRIQLVSGETKVLGKPISTASVTFNLQVENGREYSVSSTFDPVKVPRVNGFADLAKYPPCLLNDPQRQIPAIDDLKAHRIYTGPNDLSAEFRTGYNDRYFFLEVKVRDDVHVNPSPGKRIFSGDCVQFGFDANRDALMKIMRGVRGFTDDDFNFISALAGGKRVTYCYAASQETRGRLLDKVYGVQPEITRDDRNGMTVYRIRIPFADLAPLKPEKGRIFGFTVVVMDLDPQQPLYHIHYSTGLAGAQNPADFPAFIFD